MPHTKNMPPMRQRTGVLLAGLAAMELFCLAQSSSTPHHGKPPIANWQSAVNQPEIKASTARVLVLDINTGRLLAFARLEEASRTLATPGSTLKPLILYDALLLQHWDPQRRVACNRKLYVGGHELDCFHPAMDPMNAEQALTWSCNSYFAELAGSLAPGQLRQALSARGLLAATGLTPSEALATYREPQTRQQAQLLALGVEGIRVTLPELAEAYRSLAIELAAHPATAAAQTVSAGLADSASFGMAGAASLGGVPVAGKTGTAPAESGDPTHRQTHGPTHGWFVGLAPSASPQVIMAIYLPVGRGANAAQIAAVALAHSPLRKP
jgi:cell division protein FtsI/penicillin-binding protein 2